MYIVIVGCGRLGSLLANQLSADGHELVIIDRRSSSFERLAGEFTGYQLQGDGSEQSVLRQAEIHRADVVFAITSEDNVNLMVAQTASRIYNVPHVVARIFDPAREAIFRDLGVQTISPTKLTADAFMHTLQRRADS
jgi:trk system potassium uptake protein